MPRTRHEVDRSVKVAELVDVAERLFNERGYAGTTTAALADAAGVAQNAVYWYFPSKDHLFVAVLERMLDELVRDIASVRRRSFVDQVLYAVDRLEQTQDLGAALQERAREADVAAAFRDHMRATLRNILLDAVAREVPSGEHALLADSILAIADGTHGLPRATRRRLVSFAVTNLVASQT
jgi:AcrR family transcriptional regulator